MPKTCCVPFCSNTSDLERHISFFSFPKDETLKKKWIQRIRRDPGPDFTIGKYTVVCSLHFNADEMWVQGGETRRIRLLKEGVVPSKFSFPSSPETTKRPSAKKLRPQTPPTSTSEELLDHGAQLEHSYSPQTEKEKGLILQIKLQQERLEILRAEVERRREMQYYRIESVSNNDDHIRHLTGFASYKQFHSFFLRLEPSTDGMTYWSDSLEKTLQNKKCPPQESPRILSTENEFFLTMMALRRGFTDKDLSIFFNIAEETVTSILITWINLLYFMLSSLPLWPSREIIYHLPDDFKDKYPNIRVIIGDAKVSVENETSNPTQTAACSSKFKSLIGISPDQAVVFVSQLYEASMTNKELTVKSGLLRLLERGDEVVADRGFDIHDELAELGVTLVVPPMKRGSHISKEEVKKRKEISNLRMYVEDVIRKIRCFKIVDRVIQASLAGCENQIWVVCALLTNFQSDKDTPTS